MGENKLFRGCGCGDFFNGDNCFIWIVLILLLFCTDILDCICDGDNNFIWIILIVLLVCECDFGGCC